MNNQEAIEKFARIIQQWLLTQNDIYCENNSFYDFDIIRKSKVFDYIDKALIGIGINRSFNEWINIKNKI